jgi:hypothetical protein
MTSYTTAQTRGEPRRRTPPPADYSGRDRLREGIARVLCLAVCVGVAALAPGGTQAQSSVYVIDHVADGDTVTLRNGQRVRLVQIDTPEVYFGTECYGPQASATTKRLLPPSTRVRLLPDPARELRMRASGLDISCQHELMTK